MIFLFLKRQILNAKIFERPLVFMFPKRQMKQLYFASVLKLQKNDIGMVAIFVLSWMTFYYIEILFSTS